MHVAVLSREEHSSLVLQSPSLRWHSSPDQPGEHTQCLFGEDPTHVPPTSPSALQSPVRAHVPSLTWQNVPDHATEHEHVFVGRDPTHEAP